MNTGHVPREHWPEPEWPVTVPAPLPLRDRIAARFWDALQALELAWHVVGRAWQRWRDPRPFGRWR